MTCHVMLRLATFLLLSLNVGSTVDMHRVVRSYCPEDQYFDGVIEQCVPCSDVCKPHYPRDFCRINCPDYASRLLANGNGTLAASVAAAAAAAAPTTTTVRSLPQSSATDPATVPLALHPSHFTVPTLYVVLMVVIGCVFVAAFVATLVVAILCSVSRYKKASRQEDDVNSHSNDCLSYCCCDFGSKHSSVNSSEMSTNTSENNSHEAVKLMAAAEKKTSLMVYDERSPATQHSSSSNSNGSGSYIRPSMDVVKKTRFPGGAVGSDGDDVIVPNEDSRAAQSAIQLTLSIGLRHDQCNALSQVK